jgi:hypothetical protein
MAVVSITDKRVAPPTYRYTVYNRNGSVYSSADIQPTTAKCVGKYKYIDSIRGTPPSSFKLNPVTIRTAVGSVIDGYAAEASAPAPCRFIELQGPWVSQLYDMQISGLDPILNDEANILSHAAIKDAALDLGLILGEMGETLAMLRSPFASLRKYLSKVARRSPRRRALPSADVMTNTWLEYRYGLMPLVQDVSAIQAEFAKTAKQVRSPIFTERKGAYKTEHNTSLVGSGVQNFIGKAQKVHTIERKATCCSYFQKLLELEMRHEPRYWGLSPSQLPASLWELLGASFLVDWSWTVGPWLKAITPDPFVRDRGSCVSQVIHDTVEVQQLALTRSCGGSWPAQGFYPSIYRWDCKTLIRLPNPLLPDFPVPRARVLNFKRILDSCSILWNEITTLGRRH